MRSILWLGFVVTLLLVYPVYRIGFASGIMAQDYTRDRTGRIETVESCRPGWLSNRTCTAVVQWDGRERPLERIDVQGNVDARPGETVARYRVNFGRGSHLTLVIPNSQPRNAPIFWWPVLFIPVLAAWFGTVIGLSYLNARLERNAAPSSRPDDDPAGPRSRKNPRRRSARR